jgi:ATP-dependent protease ClpP protease subunit
MGFMVFLAGKKGMRILTPNCEILSHQFSGSIWGKEHELIASKRGHDITAKRIRDHYRRTTGLSLKAINEKLLPPQDIWMTAYEAKALGICDVVKDIRPPEPKGSKTKKKVDK